MESRKNILEDILHILSLGENTYLQTEIKKIQQLIKDTPNNYELGEKLRKIL